MVVISGVNNGICMNKRSLFCYNKNNEKKIYIDHKFCDKPNCMLSSPEVYTPHPDFKYCCICKVYRTQGIMRKDSDYCLNHYPHNY